MTYKPQVKTPEEILTAVGFKYDNSASRGWVRYVSDMQKPDAPCIRLRARKSRKNQRDRLHAFVVMGTLIDLHYDRDEGGKHRSVRNNSTVQKCINEFQKIDV